MIAAFDPGRNLGFALIDRDGRLLERRILALADLEGFDLPAEVTVLVGGGTGTDSVQAILRRRGIPFTVVDEMGTSEEARRLYFRYHPGRGLARLLPPGLRSPAVPIDDYAAYAIGLRYLAALRGKPLP